MSRALRSTNEPKSPTLDSRDFITCFREALQDDDIKKGLRDIFVDIIKHEVQEQLKPLTKTLKDQQKSIRDLESKIRSMEKNIDAQEQYSRRECLRLGGLKEEKDENIEVKVLQVINDKLELNPPLTANDIARTHRIGSHNPERPNVPRQTIIKFSTYRIRARVFANKKKFAGTSLSLNEDLTKTRSNTLYRARLAKKENKIKEAWSFDGRVNVRDNQNKAHYDIDSDKLDIITGRKKVITVKNTETEDEEEPQAI